MITARGSRAPVAALLRRVVPAWVALVVLVLAGPAHAVNVQKVVADGIEAWLVEDHSNPIIAVEIAMRGGAALDPPGKEGLTGFAAALLDEGAGDLSSAAFQARLEDHSITLRFDAERDALRASLKTLSRHRDVAFDQLRLALSRPRFDAEPVERVRSQIQAMLRRQNEDPDVVADRALFAALFADHPYGQPVDGTAESVQAITRDDLRAFAGRRLTRRGLIIGVVGDIDAATLGRVLVATFGTLPAGDDDDPVTAVVPRRGAQVVVEMAVPQSSVAFAQSALPRSDPDYYAFSIVNQVLGGSGLTARLFEEVREKRGLAYGVYTQPLLFDRAPLLAGHAATANARVAETVAIIRDEWTRMATFGLSADELAAAKAYLTGSLALRLTSSPRIAAALVAIQRDALGPDYFDRYRDYIEGVTLAHANRVALRILDASALTFVAVGQPVGLFWQQ